MRNRLYGFKISRDFTGREHRFRPSHPQDLADFARKPRTPEPSPQEDLFRSRLENLIAPRHPLVRLAERIDWDALNERLGAYYEDTEVG